VIWNLAEIVNLLRQETWHLQFFSLFFFLQKIFYSMDTSKDGVLSLNELQNALEKTG